MYGRYVEVCTCAFALSHLSMVGLLRGVVSVRGHLLVVSWLLILHHLSCVVFGGGAVGDSQGKCRVFCRKTVNAAVGTRALSRGESPLVQNIITNR